MLSNVKPLKLIQVELNILASLLSNRFPSAGLSVAHFCADWLLDWSLAAKWLLITQLTAAYPTYRRSKCDEGWAC